MEKEIAFLIRELALEVVNTREDKNLSSVMHGILINVGREVGKYMIEFNKLDTTERENLCRVGPYKVKKE